MKKSPLVRLVKWKRFLTNKWQQLGEKTYSSPNILYLEQMTLLTFQVAANFFQQQMQRVAFDPIHAEDRPKTSFCVQYSLYQFRVMPMGLSNSPGTFQRLMDIVLKDLKWQQCLRYKDDVIVFSKNFIEHLLNLELVLQALERAKLKIKISKCRFAYTEVAFFGHLII